MPRATSMRTGICRGLPDKHETVNHSASEYVNLRAHTNGVELLWTMLKRGYHGTHHMSEKRPGATLGSLRVAITFGSPTPATK